VPTLAEVLRQHWPEYVRQFGAQLLPSHRRAVRAILRCRTAALGGEVFRCPNCQRDRFVYHSCHHRACPQCGQAEATVWLERQKRQRLPVPYYLITFTVPAGLRPWLRSHQKLGYAQLLRQSAATLQEVAGWDKHLGAQLGFLSVLHPWGRQLQYHPHVHCVVPAGGLSPDGTAWRSPKSPHFFLPQRVLAARCRNRLRTALATGPDAADIPVEVWRCAWVVDVQPAGSGQPALKYLATYVSRTALSSQRIRHDRNGQITFQYKDSDDQQWHTLTVTAQEFLRRFLQHVLPKGFQRVRHYGWLSPAAQKRWQQVLTLLVWTAPAPPPPPPPPPPATCPHCGTPLVWIQTLPRPP
jgi:hypothetical protein